MSNDKRSKDGGRLHETVTRTADLRKCVLLAAAAEGRGLFMDMSPVNLSLLHQRTGRTGRTGTCSRLTSGGLL